MIVTFLLAASHGLFLRVKPKVGMSIWMFFISAMTDRFSFRPPAASPSTVSLASTVSSRESPRPSSASPHDLAPLPVQGPQTSGLTPIGSEPFPSKALTSDASKPLPPNLTTGLEDLDEAIRKLAEPGEPSAPSKAIKKLAPFGKDRRVRRPDLVDSLFQADPTEKVTKVFPPKNRTASASESPKPIQASSGGSFKKVSPEPQPGRRSSNSKKIDDQARPLSEVLKTYLVPEDANISRDQVGTSSSSRPSQTKQDRHSSSSSASSRPSQTKQDRHSSLDVDELSDRFLTSLLLDEKSSRHVDVGGSELLAFDRSRNGWTNRAHDDPR